MICNLVCEIKVRRWAPPILVVGHYLRWDWLMKKCFSMKVNTVPVTNSPDKE
jgi:hypothetical protein